MINDAIISVCRCLGQRGAHAVHQNYLGEAAVSGLGPDGQVTFKRPDGRLRSFHSIDRHVYWDTSVSDPTSQTSLRAGSADASGVAALPGGWDTVAPWAAECSVGGAGQRSVALGTPGGAPSFREFHRSDPRLGREDVQKSGYKCERVLGIPRFGREVAQKSS